MENNCIVEVQISTSERTTQEIIDDVRDAIKLFCKVNVDIFDVVGRGFKVGLPSYLDYQADTIAKDLSDAVDGISVVVVKKFAGIVDAEEEEVFGSDDSEPTVVEDWDTLLRNGVMVDGSNWGKEKEEEE